MRAAASRIFFSAALTIFRFSSSGFFRSLLSQTESGMRRCRPPVTAAPHLFRILAAQPAPSPLNAPMVARQRTCFPRQSSAWSRMNARTISGALEYWMGYAKTIEECAAARSAAFSSSMGTASAVSSSRRSRYSTQYLVLPVPLR